MSLQYENFRLKIFFSTGTFFTLFNFLVAEPEPQRGISYKKTEAATLIIYLPMKRT
jgi:hypothetical protein